MFIVWLMRTRRLRTIVGKNRFEVDSKASADPHKILIEFYGKNRTITKV